MKHGIVRLDNVWGVGGGLRPVKVLTKKVTTIHQKSSTNTIWLETAILSRSLEFSTFLALKGIDKTKGSVFQK